MPDKPGLSRRSFVVATGAVVAGGLVPISLGGCGTSTGPGPAGSIDKTKAFVLGKGGRRTSNAANAHNNNKRFMTREAADANRAHPGDTSRLLQIDISTKQWEAWFGNGDTMIDLRKC